MFDRDGNGFISKQELGRTLKRFKGVGWDQSPIFKKVYEEEYGQFGGEPFGCLVGDYHFDHTPPDVELLAEMSKIAAAAHAPLAARTGGGDPADLEIARAQASHAQGIVNLRDRLARWLQGRGIDQWREGEFDPAEVRREIDRGEDGDGDAEIEARAVLGDRCGRQVDRQLAGVEREAGGDRRCPHPLGCLAQRRVGQAADVEGREPSPDVALDVDEMTGDPAQRHPAGHPDAHCPTPGRKSTS